MSRNNKSIIEDIADIFSSFPWWVGPIIALPVFLFLNHFSNIEPTKNIQPNQINSFLFSTLFITLAKFLKFIIPAAIMLGSFVSLINSRKRKKLYDNLDIRKYNSLPTRNKKSPQSINDLSWQEFEMVIDEFFNRQGYSVKRNSKIGPDGGIDMILSKEGKLFIVQCKHWKKFKVGVPIIREQFGIMKSMNANGAFIITSGIFTEESIIFAQNKNISLIDGIMLKKIISENSLENCHDQSTSDQIIIPKNEPLCPKCNSTMKLRTAKKGIWVGHEFWGCSKFPQCTGTREKIND